MFLMALLKFFSSVRVSPQLSVVFLTLSLIYVQQSSCILSKVAYCKGWRIILLLTSMTSDNTSFPKSGREFLILLLFVFVLLCVQMTTKSCSILFHLVYIFLTINGCFSQWGWRSAGLKFVSFLVVFFIYRPDFFTTIWRHAQFKSTSYSSLF